MIELKSGIKIGPKEATFIIAEVGSNWQTLDDCRLSIHAAKACGADAVKFQLFDAKSLYGTDIEMNGQLPKEWIELLAKRAKEIGIEFMCSAFSPELVDFVNPFVNIHKLASAEMTHIRILEKLRGMGKPVLLSTGSQPMTYIKEVVKILDHATVIPMYCVANYPANVVDLRQITELQRAFPYNQIGYSDHSMDVLTVPKQAVELGACVIEKHFKYKEMSTPDSAHSLNPFEFKLMVQSIRGDLPQFVVPQEAMITTHKRRLIAIKDIKVGDVFQEDVNFGIYRSLKPETKALSAFAASGLNNQRSKVDIKAGDGIGPQDF